MFSGIVEGTARVERVVEHPAQLEIFFQRGELYQDIQVGDSIAHDGVCLTVHKLTEQTVSFVLGLETLQITHWNPKNLSDKTMNVEKSLRFGDRMHGHQVTGHVEAVGEVQSASWVGDNFIVHVLVPAELRPFIWKKGSIALNGVSLTINEWSDGILSVGLIPETLQRTNLKFLRAGDSLNLESDVLAKAIAQSVENYLKHRSETP